MKKEKRRWEVVHDAREKTCETHGQEISISKCATTKR
jgi:hypothetical protein